MAILRARTIRRSSCTRGNGSLPDIAGEPMRWSAQMGSDPRRARRRAEGTRDGAPGRRDRLVAAGRSDDRRRRRRLRRARIARRRLALRADHVGGAGRRSGDALADRASRRARTRNASAAGTGAPTSAPMPAHPALCGRCVANLFGAGEPRGSPDRHGSMQLNAIVLPREPSRLSAALALAVARRDRRRPGDEARDPRGDSSGRGAAADVVLQPGAGVQHGRGVQLPRRRRGWQRWLFAAIAIAACVVDGLAAASRRQRAGSARGSR